MLETYTPANVYASMDEADAEDPRKEAEDENGQPRHQEHLCKTTTPGKDFMLI